METPDDIVGHKTFDTGERDEHGFPKFRHEPLTRSEADAMWERAKTEEEKRAADMPDDKAAINALWNAQQRLKELGWREGCYSPRDGTRFQIIELGSTGIFDCNCYGEWPDCTWTSYDEHDAYPSSKPPILFKLYPTDQIAYDEKRAAARALYQRTKDCPHEPCACLDAGITTGAATCDFAGRDS